MDFLPMVSPDTLSYAITYWIYIANDMCIAVTIIAFQIYVDYSEDNYL
jgi:hypothetical protein